MARRSFVEIKYLKEGMIIDQSIVDATGHILIARGDTIEGYHITALERIGLSGVYVTDPETVIREEKIVVSTMAERMVREQTKKDMPVVALSESVKKRVAEGIQYVFTNPNDEGFLNATHDIADVLMQSIAQNNAVAVDIGLLKVSDEYTFKHSVDVASIAMIIAKRKGYSEARVREIGISGLLHDLGKTKIPLEVLNKPGKLTDEEFAIMKSHPVFGYNILKDKPGISKDILMGVLQHHEKMNGGGYPIGVSGSQISEFAKIMSIADIYDALVTERPYKKAFTRRDAVEMLMAMTGDLDIEMMKPFLDSLVLYPVGTTLELSNGKFGKVLQNNIGQPLRPKLVELSTGAVLDLAYDMKCANIIIP